MALAATKDLTVRHHDECEPGALREREVTAVRCVEAPRRGRHVVVVASEGHRRVAEIRRPPIRRIESERQEIRALLGRNEDLHPCVRAPLAGHVTRDVASPEPRGAADCEHQMSIVLAQSTADLESLRCCRVHTGHARRILERLGDPIMDAFR